MEQLKLEQTEGRPVIFVGELVRRVEGDASATKKNSSQHVLELYRTEHDGWVVVIEYRTTFSGDTNRRRVFAATSALEVMGILDAFDPSDDLRGFPPGEQFERKRQFVLEGLRRKFRAAANQLLGALPDVSETPHARQWKCDLCGEMIDDAKNGVIQWITWSGELRGQGLRLLHAKTEVTPFCQHNSATAAQFETEQQGGTPHDEPLVDYLGADGLMRLASLLLLGLPGEEVAELIKRLHVPSYEQARPYLRQAEEDGIIDLELAPGCYRQSLLREIIARYGTKAT